MTDLTPERLAELRVRAELAKPFVGHDFVAPAFTTIDAADLHALLDAADERDMLAAAVERVRALHRDEGPSQGYFPGDRGYGERDHCCGTCGEYGEYGVEWPCPTVAAVTEALS